MKNLKGTQDLRDRAHIAHGVVMSLAVVLWFPLGIFLLRLLKLNNTIRWHYIWQCTGLLLLIIGFGLGGWLGYLQDEVYTQSHEVLGTVITALFLLQPLFGWLHHRHVLAHGIKNYKRGIHVWLGRILVALGIVNGRTGLKLSDNTTAGGIVYGVVAGLIVVAYV
ncbi:hypothetical protein K469DRAFT_634599, partial [Zopfia rhizophila CBS 207.26]